MTVFTNVSDDVLEPGDPIRSVDILAIKENTNYLKQFNDFTILDTQTFTASGTWTKPSGFDSTDSVVVLVIGGGGSGGAVRNDGNNKAANGGNGGGVSIATLSYGSVAASVAITVGAGGAARSTGANVSMLNGLNGGNSSFGNTTGRGGRGGNGRQASFETERIEAPAASGSTPFVGNTNEGGINTTGGRGRDATAGTETFPIPHGLTGGGGSMGDRFGASRTQNSVAPSGLLFGDGGNGGAATGANGQIPGGGGGGATRNQAGSTSGAGARGEVRVFVVRGRVSGAQIIGVVL